MEVAQPVVQQDWRALWKIKSVKPGTQVPDHTPTSIGNPALPADALPTVEPFMKSGSAVKKEDRVEASASNATSIEASPISIGSLIPLGIEASLIQTGPCQIQDESSMEPAAHNQERSRLWIVPPSNTAGEQLNRRLFLKNLPLETSIDYVKAMVPEVVVDVKVMRKPTKGQSYALLEFASEALADESYEVLSKQSTLNGQTFIVDFRGPKSKLSPQLPFHCHSSELDKLTLYVSGLKFSTSNAEIRKHFPTANDVYYSRKGRKRPHKRSNHRKQRGLDNMFVFVKFATESAASEAFNNGQDLVIDGQRVTIQFACKVSAEEAAQKDLATTYNAPGAEDDTMGPAVKKQKTENEEYIKTEPGQEGIDDVATTNNAPDADDDAMGPAVKKQKTENEVHIKTEPGQEGINDGETYQEVSALVNDMLTNL